MIVRILGEGQFDVPEPALPALNQLDDTLEAACGDGDDVAFARALAALHQGVRDAGAPVPEDFLGPSELLLPASDATLDDVAALLGDQGLIPD